MRPSLFYKIASVALGLFAAGHTFGFRQTDPSWGVDAVVASMKTLHFNFQGFDRTYWDFFLGFGFFVTAFLLFSAVLSWQLGTMKPEWLSQMRVVRWAFAICYLAITVITWNYVFVVPGVVATVTALCLTVAAWLPVRRT
jgi:hypothetical protein